MAVRAAAAGMVIICLCAGCDRPSARADRATAPVPVETATVAKGRFPIVIEAVGQVSALRTVDVRSLVGGAILANDFKEGRYVAQGDVLVEIDPRALQATVEQDEAGLARDRASLANAAADLARYLPLVGGGVVSAQQLATQRLLVEQAKGAVAVAQAALDRDKAQLGYATIRAPFPGLLGLTVTDAGNIVVAGNPPTSVVLTQMQPIAVKVPLPQAELADVLAVKAGPGLTVDAWSMDRSRRLGSGKVAAIDNRVDAADGSFTVKADFANDDRALWPGAAVAVDLVMDVRPNAIVVPSTAIEQGPKGGYAWVVGRAGKVRMAPVETGGERRGMTLVTKGLDEGEVVVTSGQYGLRRDATVSVVPAGGGASGGKGIDGGRLGIAR